MSRVSAYRFFVFFSAWLAVVLSACGKERVPFHFVDYGELCLSTGQGQEVAPDTPLSVTVTFDWTPDCGDRYSLSQCSAALEGRTLTVTSETLFEPGPPNLVCVQAPPPAGVNCDGPPLAEGDYTVRHGSDSFALTVPAATPQGVCEAPETGTGQ